MNLVLLGPPAAGKGTQALRLSDAFGLRHLSSGDLLRTECKKGTAMGQTVARYMEAGRLVPDDTIVEVILGHLPGGEDGGFLLDGFPRTLSQAERLDEALRGQGRRLHLVISLQVPDDVILDRITGRSICPACDSVYHVEKNPPIRDNLCDRDGTPLIHREDDTQEVVSRRLRSYHTLTEPLETYYRHQGLLAEVDGTREVDAVSADLFQIIRNRMSEAGS